MFSLDSRRADSGGRGYGGAAAAATAPVDGGGGLSVDLSVACLCLAARLAGRSIYSTTVHRKLVQNRILFFLWPCSRKYRHQKTSENAFCCDHDLYTDECIADPFAVVRTRRSHFLLFRSLPSARNDRCYKYVSISSSRSGGKGPTQRARLPERV